MPETPKPPVVIVESTSPIRRLKFLAPSGESSLKADDEATDDWLVANSEPVRAALVVATYKHRNRLLVPRLVEHIIGDLYRALRIAFPTERLDIVSGVR